MPNNLATISANNLLNNETANHHFRTPNNYNNLYEIRSKLITKPHFLSISEQKGKFSALITLKLCRYNPTQSLIIILE